MAPGQTIVEVRHWTGDFDAVEPADVVIEAFACTLPATYVAAMATRKQPPFWLNLEYLSAEAWVAGCHGLPSPQAGLKKYFFFPGFFPGTGGLLRETGYAVLPPPRFSGTLDVSLFCYENPALPGLLDNWRDGQVATHCHVAAGLPHQQVTHWLGENFTAGTAIRRGNLYLHALPFLTQTDYDTLLARCHLNFVRGEDSFVRAQWAERPFVWQAYPQADAAHQVKLSAFLDRYVENLGDLGATVRRFMQGWNGEGALDWPRFAETLPDLMAHAPSWAAQIRAHGDLATNLVKKYTEFCALPL